MAGVYALDSRTSELRRRAVLVRWGTLAAAMVALTALSPALRGQLEIPLAALGHLVLLLVNLMVFERARRDRPAVIWVLASGGLYFLFVVNATGIEPSFVVWAYLFQTLPYFLGGGRLGVASVLIFDVLLALSILRAAWTGELSSHDEVFVRGLMPSMLALGGVSFLFEHLRRRAHDRLLFEVSERRRAEAEARRAVAEAKRSRDAQARFLANMSHEIRTPMNGVLGVNELLLLTTLTEEQRDYAGTINASARSLMTVLNDILDLSKIESGHVTLETQAFDLRALLASLVALYAPEAKKRGLEMTLVEAHDLPETVQGDPQRLRQVLSNLLRNAVKFTETGSVQVRVGRLEGSKDEVRFEVRDTGIGLTPAQRTKIFDAFEQADSSTTRRYGGTGLGLSISQQLVGLMGGTIGADGRPGRGSVFWFVVPLPASVVKVPAKSFEVHATPLLGGARRVLVVDDNPVNRKVVCKMLERLDLAVDTAADGEAALEKWGPGRYRVVFMDVQMPRMDGYDATRTIRGREPGGHRTPIVALTANAMQGDRERCLAAGMDDYLSKPVVFRELERVVDRFGGLPAADNEEAYQRASSENPRPPASTTAT